MPDQQGNIFFNKQTLAFSFPLILVCATHAYFKYIPLTTGVPILVGLFVLIQISSAVKSQKEQKLTNLDERTMDSIVNDIIGDDEREAAARQQQEARAKQKKAQARLAQLKKEEARKNGTKAKSKKGSDDLDDDDMLTFVNSKKGK